VSSANALLLFVFILLVILLVLVPWAGCDWVESVEQALIGGTSVRP
jgi:hypothetical protein